MTDLEPAVNTIIHRCLNVRPGEDVLVIVDQKTRAIGEALKAQASAADADAVLAIMDARAADGNEPPPQIAAAMQACDVFVAPTSKSISHTSARKQASERGTRGATMPGVTEDMLARVMAVDFDAMAARSNAVAQLLGAADAALVSCPRGSEVSFELSGRNGIADDGNLTARSAFGNLPCGEGFISPLGGEGQILASSLGGFGLSEQPVRLTIENGRLVGADEALGPRFLELLRSYGDDGTNLAELGVGTNDRAQLTGAMLEDEKILGSVHVAFGASAGIGGTVAVPIHLDVVILDASLTIGERQVLDRGRWVLDAGPA